MERSTFGAGYCGAFHIFALLAELACRGWALYSEFGPPRTKVATAKRMGVSEATVRRARNASTRSSRDEMSSTERAKGAIDTPDDTNVAIAKQMGVSEATVRHAGSPTNRHMPKCRARTERAEAAIAKTPDFTNVAIATYAAQIEVASWMG